MGDRKGALRAALRGAVRSVKAPRVAATSKELPANLADAHRAVRHAHPRSLRL